MTTQVGAVELDALGDAVGLLGELGELYPEVESEEWTPYRDLYPELFAGSSWRLPCACYLVRSAGMTVVVDTGVGPAGLWDWGREREEGLPRELAARGISPDDVDIVFLTHLHIDHLGWNADRTGTPFFPRARYVAHHDALAFALGRSELPHIQRCVVSLTDRFEELGGETELAPGLTTTPLPGHYPGHMGIRITSGGEEAMLIADVAVHPALLDRPDWRYVSDLDHELSVATRRQLLDELVDSDVLVGCGHYPGPLGRIARVDARVVWQPSGGW